MNEILRFAQDDTRDVILRREAPKNLQVRWLAGLFAIAIRLCVLICAMAIISGCATAQFEQLKKKLIRQKKENIQPVRFLEEPVRRKNSEYYEEHILYFKTWNSTLVNFIGENRKREVQSVREARRHLAALPKYLQPEYADRLQALVSEYEKVTAPLIESRLPEMYTSSVIKNLERIDLAVHRDFSFKEVKNHLLPDPAQIDLSPYQDEDSEQVSSTTGIESDDSKEATEENVGVQPIASIPQAQAGQGSSS